MPQVAVPDHHKPLLRFDAVTCVRGDNGLWSGVSLTLMPGDALQVAGPNGAGKSSLLRIAAGLLPPARGTVARGGAVGLVDDQHALDRDRTLRAALRFWAMIFGRTANSQPNSAAARTGVGDLLDVPVRLLSTGQRRRAALARLLLANPPLWLLDEPASGLDAAGVAMLEALIEEHRAGGGALLFTSHQPLAVARCTTLDLSDVAA
jgi:heme exporter protein A